MQIVDGRYCYEWKGWLFRAKDGTVEARPVGSGEWHSHPVEGCPEEDAELTSRLPDLLNFWDKDV